MNDLSLSQILKERLRLTVAHVHLPPQLRRTTASLLTWIDTLAVADSNKMPLVATESGVKFSPCDFEAAVTADFQRLTWRAAAETSQMAPALRQFFTQAGSNESALAFFDLVLQLSTPQKLGVWVEAYGGGVDCGWYIPQPMLLGRALEMVQMLDPQSRTPAKLQEWATTVKAERCLRLTRSVLAGTPCTEIRIALPGSTGDDWALAAVRLFDTLNLVDLPDEVLGALLDSTTSQMLLSIACTHRAVIKGGIMVAQPPPPLAMDFFRLATAARPPAGRDPLRQLQHNLQVDGPAWAEAQQRATGFGVEYHYDIPG